MSDLLVLSRAVAELIPGAPLQWCELSGCGGLRGFFLEEESALHPLPAEKVDAVMQAPPFWALLWPSGERLCRLLSQQPDLVRGRSVLDFGSGCGLVACAAARADAASVRAVDCDPLARLACRLNAIENGVVVQVGEQADGRPVDLLVLADFLYDGSHLRLFETLEDQAQEVLVVDSRLGALGLEGYDFLGECQGKAVPDLDPNREFGRLRFWYRGARRAEWERGLRLSTPVAQGL